MVRRVSGGQLTSLLLESGNRVLSNIVNVRSISAHFAPKIEAWSQSHDIVSITPDQVLYTDRVMWPNTAVWLVIRCWRWYGPTMTHSLSSYKTISTILTSTLRRPGRLSFLHSWWVSECLMCACVRACVCVCVSVWVCVCAGAVSSGGREAQYYNIQFATGFAAQWTGSLFLIHVFYWLYSAIFLSQYTINYN